MLRAGTGKKGCGEPSARVSSYNRKSVNALKTLVAKNVPKSYNNIVFCFGIAVTCHTMETLAFQQANRIGKLKLPCVSH